MRGALTTFWEDELYDSTLRNLAHPAITTVFVGLFTAAPGEAGGGTEVAVGAYARQSVAFTAPTDGAGDNSGDITFPVATADWGTVTHWALFDAVSAGNMIIYGPLGDPSVLFQATAADDTYHSETHGLTNDDEVIFKAIQGHALPTGLAADLKKFVINVSGNNFGISDTFQGASLDITTDGMGQVAIFKEKIIDTDDQFKFPTGNLDVAFR